MKIKRKKDTERDAQLDQLTFISNRVVFKKDHQLFFSAQDDTCFETIVTKCPNQFNINKKKNCIINSVHTSEATLPFSLSFRNARPLDTIIPLSNDANLQIQ